MDRLPPILKEPEGRAAANIEKRSASVEQTYSSSPISDQRSSTILQQQQQQIQSIHQSQRVQQLKPQQQFIINAAPAQLVGGSQGVIQGKFVGPAFLDKSDADIVAILQNTKQLALKLTDNHINPKNLSSATINTLRNDNGKTYSNYIEIVQAIIAIHNQANELAQPLGEPKGKEDVSAPSSPRVANRTEEAPRSPEMVPMRPHQEQEKDTLKAEYADKPPKSPKELVALGNKIIAEAKGLTPYGAANQIQEGEVYDPEREGKESKRRQLSLLAYQKTQAFYHALETVFSGDGMQQNQPLRKKWDNYFIGLGYEETKIWYGDIITIVTFSPQRSSNLIRNYLMAYAVKKMGGAVCSMYAHYVALRIADIAPELMVRLRSAGGHTYTTMQHPAVKSSETVVDPWPHSPHQRAHPIDQIRPEFRPDNNGKPEKTYDPKNEKAGTHFPSMSQFFKFLNDHLSEICKLAGIEDPENIKPDSAKPAKMDWDVPKSQKDN